MVTQHLSNDVLGGGLQRLVNFHLGGAIYTLPGIVVSAGVPKSLCLLLMSAALTALVYEYLWRAAVHTRQGSLARIVQVAFGSAAAAFLRILVILNAVGVVSAYVATILDVKEAAGGVASLQSVPGQYFMAMLLGGWLVVALLETHMADTMDWGSFVANAALVVLGLVLFWLAFLVHNSDSGAIEWWHVGKATPSWWQAAVDYGPNLVFAFSSAEYVLRACDVANDDGSLPSDLSNDAIKWRVRCVGLLSIGVSSALYVGMGLSGACAFGAQVHEDVLSNLRPPSVMFALVLGLNALSLLLSFPVFVEAPLLYLREFLEEFMPATLFSRWIKSNLMMSPTRPMAASLWVVPVAWLLLKLSPGLRHVINIVSAATDYYFMFVLPSLAYAVVASRKEGWPGALLGIAGVALAFVAAWMGAVSLRAALIA